MSVVAYLGPAGTYSEEAAHALHSKADSFLPRDSFDDIINAVKDGKATAGVLPIENSIEGSVYRVLDLLFEHDMVITEEYDLDIHHALMAQVAQDSLESSLESISEVHAHPQALGQCREWLRKNAPQIRQIAASSNGTAAQLASQNPQIAAIASESAAKLYGLKILTKNIEDSPSNTTRFVSVRLTQECKEPQAGDCTSIVCVLPNKPGSLYGFLGIFAKAGINLTKLESRPLPGQIWSYKFYIDLDASAGNHAVKQALIAAKSYCTELKVLGSYSRRKGTEDAA